MTARLCSLLVQAALLGNLSVMAALAKDKQPASLPADILQASTVLVVIDPDAGEPVDEPRANEKARDSVEKALAQWGRFRVALDGEEADLIVVVRTGNGRTMRPTIKGGPVDNRPVILQPGDGSIRVGGQRGQPPPLTDPTMTPQNKGPRVSNEIGSRDDSFSVYRANVAHALDFPPVWRYIAKDCLREPSVTAVEEFRKALATAQAQQPPKGP
jgi:hypothetical protein